MNLPSQAINSSIRMNGIWLVLKKSLRLQSGVAAAALTDIPNGF